MRYQYPSTTKKPRLSFEKKVLLFFLLIVAVIITVVFIYYRASVKYKTSKEWVTHTDILINQTDSLSSAHKDIVIATRGFIITGNTRLLSSFAQKAASLSGGLSNLKKLTQDYPLHQRRIDTLQSLFARYYAIREEAIRLRGQISFNFSIEARLVDQADTVVSEVQRIFHQMNNEEKNLLAARKEVYQQNIRDSVLAIRLLLLFFILLLVFAFVIVYNNIRRRNQAEAAFRKSEGLVRSIIDNAPILVNVKDTAGRYLLVNNQYAAALQTSPEDLIGKTNKGFLSTETEALIRQEDEEAIHKKRPSEIEVKLPASDGLHTYIKSKFPLFNENGNLYAIGSTATDITPIKNAHEALLKSYEQQQKIVNGFQQALRASTDLLCVINEKGEFVMVSETASQLLGYTPKELMSKSYIDFVVKEDRAATESIAKEIMVGRAISDFTNRYKRKDGTAVPIIWSAIWLEDNKMMYCLARNATERIKTSKQLAQSQSRLAYAQKIARLGNWDWDLENNLWSCSDELYALLGVQKNETDDMQQLVLTAIHPDDRPLLHKAIEEALTLGKPIVLEHRIIRSDHSVCYVQTKGEVSLDNEDKPKWFSGTMQDITERKKTELELKKLNEDLEKRAKELKFINVELERFAYVASHDLQEPLRMVTSFLALLQKRLANDLDDTSKNYIHFVVDGAERMKKLIQDLLQYSRLDSGNIKTGPVDLNEVVTNVLSVFQVTIKEKSAVVDVHDLPTVQGSKTQLTQLFQNLIGNALKFGNLDKPLIQIGCKEENDEWLISLKDNGIGIDAKYFNKIFVIFQRLHNRDEFSGTGIGLAICKKIVEMYGGRIWVESQPGQGSTFYFTLKK